MAESGPRLMLTGANAPTGRLIRPKHVAAVVLCRDRSWRPATIVAWHRLAEPYKSIITDRIATWSVCLKFGDQSEGWYLFDDRYLRPL